MIDIPDWIDYLQGNGFNFSCGSRIHGNIVPILAGIPAAVCALDSRTREMAEFFDIPIVSDKDMCNKDIYDIYNMVDYRKFNLGFARKYEFYREFLISHGIVKEINDDGRFLKSRIIDSTNRQDLINSQKRESVNKQFDLLAKHPQFCYLIDHVCDKLNFM